MAASPDRDAILIVGAGECGVRAAFALREAGFEGSVRLIGEERHLPYERPPLSKTHPVAPKIIAEEAAYVKAAIELVRGRRVTAIERAGKAVMLDDDTRLAYRMLLLATGARPRLFPGMEAALTLRTVDDAVGILGSLRAGMRLTVVGGGFIGLELAAVARRIGADVTVLEAADRLMARVVPAEVAAVAEARHRAEGVRVELNAAVRALEVGTVVLADDRRIGGDLVVAGVGSLPNTALAEAAGLRVENGIVVDKTFRTSDPNIFAAGDCAAFPYRGRHVRLESWRAAQDHGSHVAGAMLGQAGPYGRMPWFWSDQYDLCLQVAGLPEPGGRTARRDLGSGAFVVFQIADDGSLVCASGIGCGNAVARDIRLAEMMMERGIRLDPALLADPSVNLKALLKGSA
ncbi:MAG: NAD(P)/FAD-dependent oxidoreductase [Pararhizobium sp.]